MRNQLVYSLIVVFALSSCGSSINKKAGVPQPVKKSEETPAPAPGTDPAKKEEAPAGVPANPEEPPVATNPAPAPAPGEETPVAVEPKPSADNSTLAQLEEDLLAQEAILAGEEVHLAQAQADLDSAKFNKGLYTFTSLAAGITTLSGGVGFGIDYVQGMVKKAEEKATLQMQAEAQNVGEARLIEIMETDKTYRARMLKDHAYKLANEPGYLTRFQAVRSEMIAKYRGAAEKYAQRKMALWKNATDPKALRHFELSIGELKTALDKAEQSTHVKAALKMGTDATTRVAAERYFNRQIGEALKIAGKEAKLQGILLVGGLVAVGVVVSGHSGYLAVMSEGQIKVYREELAAAQVRHTESTQMVEYLRKEVEKKKAAQQPAA